MSSEVSNKPSLASLGWTRRRSRIGDAEWPYRIDGAGQDLLSWLPSATATLHAELATHGAILLRGFACDDIAAGLSTTLEALGGQLLPYEEQSSPRTPLGRGLYTSTEYPQDQEIFFHNESSYAARFPGLLGFACAAPADHGGETALIDVRSVHDRLPVPVRERFGRDGVLYVRRHAPGLGIDWRNAYGTRDRDEVIRRLVADGYAASWNHDTLEVSRIGPAVIEHPATGRRSWFNHAAFFHVTTLPPALAAALLAELGENGLPGQTYHGDGTPIASEALDVIRAGYREAAVWHGWRRGDVLLIDNLSVAHGRAPFEGKRSILVGMAGAYRSIGTTGVRRVEPCT